MGKSGLPGGKYHVVVKVFLMGRAGLRSSIGFVG